MTLSRNNPELLGTEPVGRLLKRYALPAIIAMSSSSLYNIIDSIFIGHGVGAMAISGLAIAMPLISVWTSVAALVGGVLAADVTLGISGSYFLEALPKAVPVANLTLACAKSVVFGLFIALIGCHFGLRVKPNTESLGQGTTASVVASITAVILIDALFAVLFKSVGI